MGANFLARTILGPKRLGSVHPRYVGSALCSDGRRRARYLLSALPLFVGACRFGTADIHIGFNVSTTTAPEPDGAAGATSCTLLRSEGPVGYAVGEVGRLEGTHILTAKHSGKCAAAGGCASNQEVVEQSACNVSLCQMWQSLEVDIGWFVLTNASTGGCLDVGNGSMIDGGTIQSWSCHARANQQWQAVCAGDNSWKIVNRNSALLLRVVGTNDGDIAQQWSDVGSDSQRWEITSQPSAYTALVPTSEEVGQTWSYTTEQPTGTWQDPAFDDTSWGKSLAPFGTRYERPWVPATDWNLPDIWLRREFSLAVVPASLDVRIFHNGPAEVYVNGNLAYEGSSSVGYRVAPVKEGVLASLVRGSNDVAVHCRQNTDGSYGPFIDLGLGRFVWR